MGIVLVPNLLPALPEIILATGACTLLLLGVLHDKAKAWVPFLAKLLLAVVLFCVVVYSMPRTVTFNGLFITDAFAAFCKVLILAFAGGVLLASRKTLILENIESFEYPLLVLFSLVGMMVMVSANNLLSLAQGKIES